MGKTGGKGKTNSAEVYFRVRVLGIMEQCRPYLFGKNFDTI